MELVPHDATRTLIVGSDAAGIWHVQILDLTEPPARLIDPAGTEQPTRDAALHAARGWLRSYDIDPASVTQRQRSDFEARMRLEQASVQIANLQAHIG